VFGTQDLFALLQQLFGHPLGLVIPPWLEEFLNPGAHFLGFGKLSLRVVRSSLLLGPGVGLRGSGGVAGNS
jgi:hypothetical protein